MPRFFNPVRHTGPNVDTMARIVRSRAPTTADYRRPETNAYYEVGSVWVDSTNDEPWILVDITSNSATWVRFAGSSTDIISITGDDSDVVIADSDGNLDIQGKTVANATRTKPVWTEGTIASNLIEVEVQVAADVTGAPGDKNDAGISSYSDAQFSVDADGYVTLKGGTGPTTLTLTGDDSTAVGPDGAGDIDILGITVANGTFAKPLYVDGDAAGFNLDIKLQVAADRTGAPGDKNDAGICSFDDTGFSVDADGYVTLVGGGGPATLTLSGDEGSGNVPDGSGNIAITGDTVANATHAKPVYVDDTAASASTIDVQVATTAASAPSDKNDAGLASFDSSTFAVTTHGYVTFLGDSVISVPVPGGMVQNLGLTLASNTLSVASADGTALSASNKGYVILPGKTNPIQFLRISVEANQGFIDSGGVSEISGNLFGLTTGVAATNAVGFYIYAVLNDDEDAVAFMISRVPNLRLSPAVAEIGAPDDPVADKQHSFFSFDNIDETKYDANPCVMVGSLNMTKTAGDDWTVATASTEYGIGYFNQNKMFRMPTGHFGAASGKYFVDNGGTAPGFSDNNYLYMVNPLENTCTLYLYFSNVNVAGVGAVDAQLACPYIIGPNSSTTYRADTAVIFVDNSGGSTRNLRHMDIFQGTQVATFIPDGTGSGMDNADFDTDDDLYGVFKYPISNDE